MPGCVEEVLLRGDGEFFGWESVNACIKADFEYIIANKKAFPPFDPKRWYRPKKRKPFEYITVVSINLSAGELHTDLWQREFKKNKNMDLPDLFKAGDIY